MHITLTDDQAQNFGEQIIRLLDLPIIKRGDEKGRVETNWGTKTPQGLARSIISLMVENKELVSSLKEIFEKSE